MAGEIGKCRACPAQVRWAIMVDADNRPKVKNGKPVRNPLDVAELAVDEVTAATHAVGFNPNTGRGLMVTAANLERMLGWARAGSISLHLSHFATCPQRQRFTTGKG